MYPVYRAALIRSDRIANGIVVPGDNFIGSGKIPK